jgi:hypothetical protein
MSNASPATPAALRPVVTYEPPNQIVNVKAELVATLEAFLRGPLVII